MISWILSFFTPRVSEWYIRDMRSFRRHIAEIERSKGWIE